MAKNEPRSKQISKRGIAQTFDGNALAVCRPRRLQNIATSPKFNVNECFMRQTEEATSSTLTDDLPLRLINGTGLVNGRSEVSSKIITTKSMKMTRCLRQFKSKQSHNFLHLLRPITVSSSPANSTATCIASETGLGQNLTDLYKLVVATSDKLVTFRWDIHAVERSRNGAIDLANLAAVVALPVHHLAVCSWRDDLSKAQSW